MSKNKLKKKIKRQNQYEKLEMKRFWNFIFFWQFILDDAPRFCVLCGRYIPKAIYLVIKQLKGNNLIHIECAKQFVTYNIINSRISEESLLICDYEPIEKIPKHLKFPMLAIKPIVCRTKVKNTQADLLAHLIKGHDYDVDNFEDFRKMRHDYFLKPTGVPFPKVRVY